MSLCLALIIFKLAASTCVDLDVQVTDMIFVFVNCLKDLFKRRLILANILSQIIEHAFGVVEKREILSPILAEF